MAKEDILVDAMQLSKYLYPCIECVGEKVLDKGSIQNNFEQKKDNVFTTSLGKSWACTRP